MSEHLRQPAWQVDEYGRAWPSDPSDPLAQGYPQHQAFEEGQREQIDDRAIRWGDEDNPTHTVISVEEMTPIAFTSKQLCNAHVKRPITWLLQFNADGVQVPTGEVNNIRVEFAVSHGCGQSRTTIIQPILLLAANAWHWQQGAIGGTPPFVPPSQWMIPASDIQVQATVRYTPTVSGIVTIAVGCMMAPYSALRGGE